MTSLAYKLNGPTAARRRLPLAMSLADAKQIAGTLGKPSKLPGFSYGLSAHQCKTGSKLRAVPGSVCASCYAHNDFYATWTPVALGHARRFMGLKHPRWCDAMVRLIEHHCTPPNDFFRWHDSGDLQGAWHLQNIVAVCERTPQIRHWLPTREYSTVIEFLDAGGHVPDNLVIRLSGHMIDAEPVVPPRLAGFPVSTVSSVSYRVSGIRIVEGKGSVECRAVEARDNHCGPCRACWSKEVSCVSYPEH
jgi:hypothetical protein